MANETAGYFLPASLGAYICHLFWLFTAWRAALRPGPLATALGDSAPSLGAGAPPPGAPCGSAHRCFHPCCPHRRYRPHPLRRPRRRPRTLGTCWPGVVVLGRYVQVPPGFEPGADIIDTLPCINIAFRRTVPDDRDGTTTIIWCRLPSGTITIRDDHRDRQVANRHVLHARLDRGRATASSQVVACAGLGYRSTA